MKVLKAIASLFLILFLLGCISQSQPHKITIAEIKASPSKFSGKMVLVKGKYMGWNCKEAPPVTRSDWCVDDGTGKIYVTKCGPGNPLTDTGKNVTVIGYVETAKGKPYIKAIECKIG